MEITIETIRSLAKNDQLKTTLKYDDSFIVSEDVKAEVEELLHAAKKGYQAITQSSNNVMFIIQPYGEQG